MSPGADKQKIHMIYLKAWVNDMVTQSSEPPDAHVQTA